jgi:hypothetical protein
MAKAASEAGTKRKQMEEELASYQEKWNTDVAVAQQAIADLVATMGPDVASRWRVDNLAKTPPGKYDARDMYNVVCASREALLRSQQGAPPIAPTTSAPKRQRVEASPPAAARAAAPVAQKDPVSVSQSSFLRAALANTFETRA